MDTEELPDSLAALSPHAQKLYRDYRAAGLEKRAAEALTHEMAALAASMTTHLEGMFREALQRATKTGDDLMDGGE